MRYAFPLLTVGLLDCIVIQLDTAQGSVKIGTGLLLMWTLYHLSLVWIDNIGHLLGLHPLVVRNNSFPDWLSDMCSDRDGTLAVLSVSEKEQTEMELANLVKVVLGCKMSSTWFPHPWNHPGRVAWLFMYLLLFLLSSHCTCCRPWSGWRPLQGDRWECIVRCQFVESKAALWDSLIPSPKARKYCKIEDDPNPQCFSS